MPIYVRIEGDRTDSPAYDQAAWDILAYEITGTYFETIIDPFRYIIRHMVVLEYLGVAGNHHLWHHNGKFYAELTGEFSGFYALRDIFEFECCADTTKIRDALEGSTLKRGASWNVSFCDGKKVLVAT